MEQLAMTNPADWCTFAWAAKRMGCDERTVRRLIADGRLHVFRPRLGPGESDRHKLMLHVPEVERYADARNLVAGRA